MESDAPAGQLVVSPSGPIALGFFEEQLFTVQLTDAFGVPLADEPVQASLIGPAHNGGLDPFELTTDDDGRGELVFAAPDQAAELQIRFSSPAASEDSLVDVSVDPSALELTLEVEYDGARALTSVVAELIADTTCAELAEGNGAEPHETQTSSALPATFVFDGLLAATEYAVSARGRNAVGESRAVACLDGLLPNTPAGPLVLADLPLDLAGAFTVTTDVTTAGALDPAVDALAESVAPFSSDVPAAILDAIRDVIDDEPVAGETFDQIRADDELDAVLGQDLDERSVDVPGLLAALWTQVKARLVEVELGGTIEISAPNEGTHDVLHRVEAIAFTEVEGSFLVAVPEIGEASAAADPGDPDLLLLGTHPVGLGLGGPLEFVLGEEIESSLGEADLPAALEEEVDCEAVVAVLATPLAGVADSSSILAGCQDAMLAAGGLLDDGVALLSANYGQLSFEDGSCRLADPGVGDQVTALVNGEFVIQWTGTSSLGPMSATFLGELTAD